MKILIDIGHPAHVHLYKNLYFELQKKGASIIVMVKNIPPAINLLKAYGIPHRFIGLKRDTIIQKALRQVSYDMRILSIVIKEGVDIGLGTSLTNAHVSAISRMHSIMFDDDDDEVQPLMVRYGHPFASCILSPDVLKNSRHRKDTIYYPGYHELAYLHPVRFQPDDSVLDEIGLKTGDPYFLMRFNVFKAHHDTGNRGLSLEQKRSLISVLSKHGRVFITTEREMEPDLMKYRLVLPPEKVHSLLANATLFVGDSQTMASEAAVLGVPSLRCNTFAGRISYLEEQESKYGLTYGFLPEQFDQLIERLNRLLSMADMQNEWQRRRNIMLMDKIDVTSFMVWFVENYPQSIEDIEDTIVFWSRFR